MNVSSGLVFSCMSPLLPNVIDHENVQVEFCVMKGAKLLQKSALNP